MAELEERIRRYAEATIETVPPVGVEEVRARATARVRALPTRWVAIAAAAVALTAAVAALRAGDPGDTTLTSAAEYPLTLDGHRDWQVAVLNGAPLLGDEELARRLSDDFRAAVPPHVFREGIANLASFAPWSVLREVERRPDSLAVQLVADAGAQVRLTLTQGADGRLVGATVLEATPCADLLGSDTALAPTLDQRLRWLLAELNASTSPSDAALEESFARSFLESVPPDRLRSQLAEVSALGPFHLRAFEGRPQANSLTARVGLRTGEEARLVLRTEAEAPHQITAMTVLTQQPCEMAVEGE